MGLAYVEFALDNPERYRLMFRTELSQDGTSEAPTDADAAGGGAFATLMTAVQDAGDQGLLREGVDPDALYDVITHSAGNSWMFENRVPHILKGDYTPLSAVDIFVKDLGMVLDTARTSKFPLPLSAAAHQMFMMASTAGHGGEDDSAVIKIFPGIELPGKAE